ncbi:MAG: hypothetical protein JWL59_2316 [Chthoniobacteraceae bacterium]|nr:hypothetical protein [Chthoniobacteraceae bacterium]
MRLTSRFFATHLCIMRKRIIRSSAILASSLASLAPHSHAEGPEASKYTKRLRESALAPTDMALPKSTGVTDPPPAPGADRYPWKNSIVTTTFWIGEKPTKNNPTPNHVSSWDMHWAENFGGTDDPDKGNRANYMPASFVPQQNPFYVALPYNDLERGGHKAEAAQVIPWFKQAFKGAGKTVLKGRWLAIRFRGKVCYAQWEDCGPFRTDHWQYVFGNERPKPNLNRGAGLDVSPAVRDFLGMADTDVTDWKFVEFEEIPSGPWATHGDNNTFVMNQRRLNTEVVSTKKSLTPLP